MARIRVLKESHVYHRAEPKYAGGTYAIYKRRVRHYRNTALFRLHHEILIMDDLNKADDQLTGYLLGMMSAADQEGKPVEINVQWLPVGSMAPGKFQP